MRKGQSFEYGGYHFTPLRQFCKNEGDFFALSKRLEIDPELGISTYKERQKIPYDYEGFYAASTDRTCDIFRCEENGRIYVPGRNELFIYHDPLLKDAAKESYLHAHLLEENVLFTASRLDRSSIPGSLFVYELGYKDDYDTPDRVADAVGRKFFGTVISEIRLETGGGLGMIDTAAGDFFFDTDHREDTFSIRDFPEIYPKESVLAMLKETPAQADGDLSAQRPKKEPEHGR